MTKAIRARGFGRVMQAVVRHKSDDALAAEIRQITEDVRREEDEHRAAVRQEEAARVAARVPPPVAG